MRAHRWEWTFLQHSPTTNARPFNLGQPCADLIDDKLAPCSREDQTVAEREADPVGAWCFLQLATDLLEGIVSPKPSFDVHMQPDGGKYGALCAFVLQYLLRLEAMNPALYREAYG